MRRSRRLLALLAAMTLTVSTAVTAAEEPSASPDAATADACALLTGDEVSAALGEAVSPTLLAPGVCLFGDPSVSLTGLTLAQIGGADAAAALEQAESMASAIVVAGVPAFQAPVETLDGGRVRSQLLVETGSGTALILSADAAEGVDVAAAVLQLAELAVPRLATTPVPVASAEVSSPAASLVPEPSAPTASAARTGLAALFPAQAGESPVSVEVQLSGRQFLSQVVGFRPMEQRVTRALRRRDMGIGDLSFAQASTPTGSVILAFQVDGGRINPLVSVLLESLGMERTGDEPRPADVGGKEGVFEILSGSEGLAYVSGDTLWLVFSQGPEQVAIFEQLP
jgi:hypothetical protein